MDADERWWAPAPGDGPREGSAADGPGDTPAEDLPTEERPAEERPTVGGEVEERPTAGGEAEGRGGDRPARGPSPPDLIGDLRERLEDLAVRPDRVGQQTADRREQRGHRQNAAGSSQVPKASRSTSEISPTVQ